MLEGELDGVGLGGASRLRRVRGSAAGGHYRRRRGRPERGGGGGPGALGLGGVVEEQLVRLEGGGEGEEVGEEEEEGREHEEGATPRGHGFG